jgi:hypothetical protein
MAWPLPVTRSMTHAARGVQDLSDAQPWKWHYGPWRSHAIVERDDRIRFIGVVSVSSVPSRSPRACPPPITRQLRDRSANPRICRLGVSISSASRRARLAVPEPTATIVRIRTPPVTGPLGYRRRLTGPRWCGAGRHEIPDWQPVMLGMATPVIQKITIPAIPMMTLRPEPPGRSPDRIPPSGPHRAPTARGS